MKSLTTTLLVLLCPVAVAKSTLHPRSDPKPECCEEIKQALDDSLAIKPGAARQEVEKLFEVDGGANTRPHTRYTYRKCIYVHLDLDFKLAPPSSSLDLSPKDTVIKTSKPYLAYPTVD